MTVIFTYQGIDVSDDWQALNTMKAQVDIERALKKLPKRQSQSMKLRIEGYKYREIASLLGISIGSVKKYLYRARMTTKKVLGW